jgi:hypothetical protein
MSTIRACTDKSGAWFGRSRYPLISEQRTNCGTSLEVADGPED